MVTDLAIAREQVRSTQEQLIHAEKMASLGQLTAGIAHEIQNPLNFVNNFGEICIELVQEIEDSQSEEEKDELRTTLKSNLEKIVCHGKGADRIVKAMLMHSREKRGGQVATDINELLVGDISIAFHGTRKKYHDLKCELVTSYDSDAGYVNVVPQDISQVVINLLNNAFYAVRQKMQALKREGEETYHPLVKLSTERDRGKVIVRIEDNGNGIPEDVRDKIFNPFFTTKPPGEGTGLGLSLSYDLIKANNGKLILQNSNSDGTVFEIHLRD
jgi:C4-dicarboxylate-specific signal transduction histidine kinase